MKDLAVAYAMKRRGMMPKEINKPKQEKMKSTHEKMVEGAMKPMNMAEGGEVKPSPSPSPEEARQNKDREFLHNMRQGELARAKGYAHGGEVACMYCGGMAGDDISGDDAAERFEMGNSSAADVDNEMGDSDPLFAMDEEESKKQVKPSGMLLSRILGGLRKAHSGKA